MPATTITCPFCNTTLKPKTPVPGGTRLKCPKCTTIFVVKADDAEDVPPTVAAPPKPAGPQLGAPISSRTTPKPPAPKPPPARAAAPKPPPADEDIPEVTEVIEDEDGDEGGAPAKPKKKAIPLWVWLVGGGVGLFVLCGCCGTGGWFASGWFGLNPFGGASVTQANYDKIKMGSSEKDVTDFMGTPTLKQSADDILKSMPIKPPKGPSTDIKSLTWKGGSDEFITVSFVKDKAVAKTAKIGMVTESEGNPFAAFGP